MLQRKIVKCVESQRRSVNSLVSTKRCWSAVRNEVVLACQNYVSQRLKDKQMSTSRRIEDFIQAKSVTKVINVVRLDVENVYRKQKLTGLLTM